VGQWATILRIASWRRLSGVLLVLLAIAAGTVRGAGRQTYMPGQILVKLKDGSTTSTSVSSDVSQTLSRLRGEYGLRGSNEDAARVSSQRVGNRRVYRFVTPENILRLCEKLRNDPRVEYAQPNYCYQLQAVPNDPMYVQQYAHDLTQMDLAWDLNTGSRGVVVAVLGTGIDTTHPDLRDNIWVNGGEIANNGLDDDGNGYVDDVHGWDFDEDDGDIYPTGSSSERMHETAVAGVIAATGNNGVGVAGVNWQCSLMGLRLSDDLTSLEIAEALRYATANGAHVINMSFSGTEIDPLLNEAIDEAHENGILLVASAGNDALDMLNYPAARYNVMAVAATDSDDLRTFSNFGLWVDIDAPGDYLATTDVDGSYTYISGTSFSCPYVAGLAALLWAHRPELTATDVRAILENTTDPLDPGPLDPDRTYMGTGRVNAYQALTDTSTLPPFGEIVEPRFGAEIEEQTMSLDVTFLAQGQTYQLDLRPFDNPEWSPIGQGEVANTNQIQMTAAKPNPGTYVIRLTVTTENRSHVDSKIFTVTTSPTQENWPTEIVGASYAEYLTSSPVCIDLDGDGRHEVIQSSSISHEPFVDTAALLGARTYVWDRSGTPLNGWPQELDDMPTNSSSAVGDVDGDGDYEVVTVTDWTGTVYVWDAETGQPADGKWPRTLNPSGAYWNSSIPCPTLADLDGDGDSEIIVGINPIYGGEDATGLYALDGDGGTVWRTSYDVCGLVTAADIDRDGDVELAFSGYGAGSDGRYDFQTYLLDHQGQLLQQWSGGTDIGTVVADLDADREMEIVFCTENRVRAVHADGSTLWTSSALDGFSSVGAMSIGDLDGDGYGEVLINSYQEGDLYEYGQIWALDHRGHVLQEAGFPKTVLGYSLNSTPVIGDIDGDGEQEVLVGSAGTELAAWNLDGTAVAEFPRLGLDPEYYATPALSDLDGDGDMEILFGGYDGRFYAIDLPVDYAAERIDWGSFRHDPQCSGWALQSPRIETLSVPDHATEGQVAKITVSISNPDDVPVRVSVKDLPDGASFDHQTDTLTWTPQATQAGNTYTFTFFVTDGVRQDRRSATITVIP